MRRLILFALLPLAAAAQQYTISTVAGIGLQPFTGSGGPAAGAQLISPICVAADSAGNTFVTDSYYHQVFRISPDGVITLYAGTGKQGFSGDQGPATAAQLNNPLGLAVDGAGDLFIVDNGNGRIREVTPDGTISTYATVQGAYLAIDGAGALYLSQTGANLIHKVAPDGTVTTYAGTGQVGSGGDGGPATAAQFFSPSSLSVDSAGNVYVADSLNNKVRKITAQGVISTLAGTGQAGFSGDGGPATQATLDHPTDVAVDANGAVYIADSYNLRIRKVTPDGIVTTVAGSLPGGGFGQMLADGPAAEEFLVLPNYLAIDNGGNLIIAVSGLRQVRRLTGSNISTIAGILPTSEPTDNGPATSALFLNPYGIAIDSGGSIYVGDNSDNRIRKITPDGIITTYSGDGVPEDANPGGPPFQTYSPGSLAFDPAGNLYYANGVWVREIVTNGIVEAFAGSGVVGFSGDGGPAVAAEVGLAMGLAADAQGNIFFSDRTNHRVRRVDAITGYISTVAGNGTPGYSGDNGPATAAELNLPLFLAVDANGNLYIADVNNARIRKVTPDGNITTAAGNGTVGSGGDGGDAGAAQFSASGGLVVDAAGNLFIGDGSRIRRVDAETNIISTIAGTGVAGFSGDGGAATNAMINSPAMLVLDGAGNILFADTGNQRVRKLTLSQ